MERSFLFLREACKACLPVRHKAGGLAEFDGSFDDQQPHTCLLVCASGSLYLILRKLPGSRDCF